MFQVFPLVLMTNILPITIGNLGIREGTTIFLLDTFGISSEIAFNISIILFFMHSIIPAIIGLLLNNFDNKEKNKN